MATVTTSIGSNSSIDTETPSGSTGSGPWVVTFGTTPTGISIGDKAAITDHSMTSDYTFLVTAISGSNITLTYVTDDGMMGDTNPYGMLASDYVSQAPVLFQRYYSTITSWAADLDSGYTMDGLYTSGDDAVGECHADSTFVESPVTIQYGDSVGLASITLTAHADSRHDGTKGSGVIVQNSGSGYLFYLNIDNITLSWLEVDGTDSVNQAIAIQADGVHIANNLIYDFYNSSGVLVGIYNDSCCPYYTNNFIWNFTRSGSGLASIFYSTGTGAGIKCYNNTVYHLDFGATSGHIFYNNLGDADTKVRNLILMDVGDEALSNVGTAPAEMDYWGLEPSGREISNEALDTVANTFVDSTVSDPDLHLKSLCNFLRAGVDLGTSPTNVNIDIDGRDRDAQADVWDIGADQCESCATRAAGTITKTIGTTGRDYTTITLWEADLDDTSIYMSGDDAVGECYNDSEFDERVTINGGGTVGLSSVKLSVASGQRHDGTAGTGARIVKSADWEDGIIYSDYDMPVTIEWLEIDGAGYGDVPSSGHVGSVIQVGGITQDASLYRKIIKNCIVHDMNGDDKHMYAVYRRDNKCTWTVMNNMIYDLGVNSSSRNLKGIVTFATSPGATYYYNNTVYKLTNNGDNGSSTGIQVDDDTDEILKNNLICDVDLGSTSGMQDCYSGNSGSAPYRTQEAYNLTSDSTSAGTGALTGKSAADQFVSIANGAEDLHLKNNADALRAGVDLGTTPTGVSIDIDGRDRDAEGDELWDIGADQCDSCAEPAGSTDSYLNMTTLGVG